MTMPNKASQTHLSHPKYRPDIDGLRAIAVMSVVLFHAFPSGVPGGFIGVDIFFVISGYLISTIIYSSLERNSFSFAEFYARRIKRIFPALLLVLVSCYAFGWFTLFADEFGQLGKHIAGGAGFISNFVLWNESGYFDTTSEIKPLLHLWSLGIEEQFYIFWPFILWAAWKVRVNTLVATIIILAASFFLNIINVHSYPTETFYFPQSRAWELLFGSVLAYVTIHGYTKHISLRLRNIMSVAGIALLVHGFHAVKNSGFPGWHAMIPCLGAVLIIMAGQQAWINNKILSSKPFVWLGLISFPLYLWHWPLLTFPRIIEGETPAWCIRAISVALSLILAWLTFYYVEKSLKGSRIKLKTLILSVGMLIMGSVGLATYMLDGIPKRGSIVKYKEINKQYTAITDFSLIQNETCLNRYTFEEAKKYFWFCVTNKDSNPSIVLLGNSYANHLYPGLVKSYPNKTILSIGTCDPGMPDSSTFADGPCSESKPKRQADFIDGIIKNSGSVKTVIIDFHHNPRTMDYFKKLVSRISYMQEMGIKVVIFIPHLTINYNIKTCFSRPLNQSEHDCYINEEEHKKLIDGLSDGIKYIKSHLNNVYFYDQNDVFKSGNGYSVIIDGIPAFRDEYNHYSIYASEKVGESFRKWAKTNNIIID